MPGNRFEFQWPAAASLFQHAAQARLRLAASADFFASSRLGRLEFVTDAQLFGRKDVSNSRHDGIDCRHL